MGNSCLANVKSLYKKFFKNAMIISISTWMQLKAVFFSHKDTTAMNYNYRHLNILNNFNASRVSIQIDLEVT